MSMTFTEAMVHVSQNDGSAVVRPEAREFVWYDHSSPYGGRPLGFREEPLNGSRSARGYMPTLEDILASDWSILDTATLSRR